MSRIDEREQINILMQSLKDIQALREKDKEDYYKKQEELNKRIGTLSKENYELKKQLKDLNVQQ